MISVHFFLKTPKKKYSPIYVRVHLDGKEIGAVSIHESIQTNWNEAKGKHIKPIWNHEEQRATNYKLLNEKIADLKSRIDNMIRAKRLIGEMPTSYDIAVIINPLKAKSKNVSKKPILVKDWYQAWGEWYLEKKNRRARKMNIKEVAGKDYVRQYKQICDKVHKFMPDAKLTDFLPQKGERPEEGLFYDYEDWVLENYDLQDNTLVGYRKFFRVMCRFAGFPVDWLPSGSTSKNSKFALEWQEVLSLANTKYSSTEVTQAAHGAIIMCQVAFRWGDVFRLQDGHFFPKQTRRHGEVLVINKNQNKTADPIYVPLPPRAQALYEKYKGVPVHFQKTLNNARTDFNKYLKQAALEADLTRSIRITKRYQGQIEESWHPLHDLISAHVLRHTGGTLIDNLFEGENRMLVRRLLGHADNDVTAGYIHADPIITVDKLLDAWDKIDV